VQGNSLLVRNFGYRLIPITAVVGWGGNTESL